MNYISKVFFVLDTIYEYLGIIMYAKLMLRLK